MARKIRDFTVPTGQSDARQSSNASPDLGQQERRLDPRQLIGPVQVHVGPALSYPPVARKHRRSPSGAPSSEWRLPLPEPYKSGKCFSYLEHRPADGSGWNRWKTRMARPGLLTSPRRGAVPVRYTAGYDGVPVRRAWFRSSSATTRGGSRVTLCPRTRPAGRLPHSARPPAVIISRWFAGTVARFGGESARVSSTNRRSA